MKVPGFYKTTFLLISSLILLFSCTAPSEDISSGESENSGVQDVTSGENSGSTTVPEQSVETEKDIFYQAEWTSYHVAWNREGTDLLSQWLPWDDIQENFIVIKNGSIYLYSLYSWNQHIGPSSVEYYENLYPYSIRYEDIYLEGTATIVRKKIRYFYTNENGYTENLDFEKEGNKIILKFNGYYYWLKKTANTNSMDENLKDLYIEPLIDSNSFEENILIEDDNEKTISFNLSTHENEGSTGSSSEAGSIPTVIAYWDISSGKDYISFT